MAPGGFTSMLPKDLLSPTVPMAWTYRTLSSEPNYFLTGQDGYTELIWQIDCHGLRASDARSLAMAIDATLRGGFAGTLSDADRTVVQGIFRLGPALDGYDPINRTFVKTLEYQIICVQP